MSLVARSWDFFFGLGMFLGLGLEKGKHTNAQL
jgi:hypothetical protein